jgi:hypothetical protein
MLASDMTTDITDNTETMSVLSVGQGKFTNVFCSEKGHFASTDGL